MAKRVVQARQELFNIDLESLLTSELSPLKQNDSQSSTSEPSKPPKKFKTKDNKGFSFKTPQGQCRGGKEENEGLEGAEEAYDLTKFFENVGNDFYKSLQVRKSRLGQFTDSVISIYQSRITEMIKKQEIETEQLREQTVNNIEEEISKCEDEFRKLQQQENKLMKILEQQLKLMQKASDTQRAWIEHFRKQHHNYFQAFEELQRKHKNEYLDIKKAIAAEVSELQSKFLAESKKEETKTVKKYLSSLCF